MYVLRSKKTGIECGWSEVLWNSGGFEIADDDSGLPTPPKVLAGIRQVTGLDVQTAAPVPAPSPLEQPEPPGVLTAAEAAPALPVTEPDEPATVPSGLFAGEAGGNAEDNS